MRAWLIDGFEGIGGLRLGELPEPVAGPGEAVLTMRYASLNPADRYLAEGLYPATPPLPHVLGRDGVGVVTAVGEGVQGVRVGETRVVLRGEAGVTRAGTFAERVAVPAEVLVDVPAGWSETEAAGAPLVYLTAYQAITQWEGRDAMSPGQVVLVSGASGGVGLATIHLASAMGLVVVGLSRDGSKFDRLMAEGATLMLNPNDADWRETLYRQLGRRPVQLVVDNIAGPLFEALLETLGPRGKVSVVGRLGGPVPSFNTGSLFFRRLRVGGVAVGTYTADESRSAWGEIVRLLTATGRRPVVDSVFEFERLPEAFERLRGGVLGKVLLRVSAGTA
ncbi:MAG: zinc-binding alcohol dehydrogenase family protein [Tepidisphaerales bacterium]